jgi:type II secretory ATPase GspE/PulE/Tfp pilus assembly ATPase PilB-like protein
VRKLAESNVRRSLSRAELAALGKVVDLERMLDLLKKERIIGAKDGWGAIACGSSKSAAFDGSVGIHEVLVVTPAIRDLILKGASASEIHARARKEGMVSLLEDAVFAAARGFTTIEEALRAVSGS